jgi:hypothetical protein
MPFLTTMAYPSLKTMTRSVESSSSDVAAFKGVRAGLVSLAVAKLERQTAVAIVKSENPKLKFIVVSR